MGNLIKRGAVLIAAILTLLVIIYIVFTQTNFARYLISTTVYFDRCDVDRDGDCDSSDIDLFNRSLGACDTGDNYNELADSDHDGCVTEVDRKQLFP